MNKREKKKALGATDVQRNVMGKSLPSWMLIRPGDKCLVCELGIRQEGYCKRIIHLSCGKRLIVMVGPDGNEIGIFNAWQAELADHVARILHVTTYEALLKKYEPKGMTTANG